MGFTGNSGSGVDTVFKLGEDGNEIELDYDHIKYI